MYTARMADPVSSNSKVQPQSKGGTFAAAFHYTEERAPGASQGKSARESDRRENGFVDGLSPQRERTLRSAGMNGYNATPDLPPPIYVRALYDYVADDHTSLSFRQGDVIQVLTQLESGWWDGVINDVRGWFPSNYCAVFSNPDDAGEFGPNGHETESSAGSGTEDEEYDEQDEDQLSDGNPRDDELDLPIETKGSRDQEEAAFWIPQATPDGRLFYFNTLTGVSTMELPLETPTSANETGPPDRTHFHIPEQTRPPPEMLARGFEQDGDDYDGSASEADGDSIKQAAQAKRRSQLSDGVPGPVLLDSTTPSPDLKLSNNTRDMHASANNISLLHQASHAMEPIGTTSTSFAINPGAHLTQSLTPRYFFDDGTTIPTNWSVLVENMRLSVDAYRQAVKTHDRADFVGKAEDISDHLRMLLAAGSGTTDNHSGNPSIISTNKALYPHFRDMMSRFSKLVLSSHIAAADWPGPDAFAKCLQEADGVLHGVYGYVEVARHQRGEDIPRLVPGFVLGSNTGGNWQNNNIRLRDPMNASSFIDHDEYENNVEPSVTLDAQLLSRIDEARKTLISCTRRLHDEVVLNEKIISPSKQTTIGDAICTGASQIIDAFKPWVAMVESINLSPLVSNFENPQLTDFNLQKQKSYDHIAELITSCQSVTAPLADEWAEVRGDSLEDRLSYVRAISRQLDSSISQMGYTLQLLRDVMPTGGAASLIKEHRVSRGGETSQKSEARTEPVGSPSDRGRLGSLGNEVLPERLKRTNNAEKATRFFGQIPPTDIGPRDSGSEPASATEETHWFLQLDHEGEVSYDTRSIPRQLKSGTLTGFVEQLTRHDRLDAPFNGTFLLTYRSFTTGSELFDLLVRRFNIQPPPGLTREDYPIWEEKKQKLVRFRVVNILKSWFENYWMEGNDETSQRLLERVYSFAQNSIASTKTPGSGPLMSVVEQRMKGQDTSAKRLVLTLSNSAPVPILPKNMKKLKFLDIDVTEFARQLTIIESKLYGKIKPTECLNKTWQKKVEGDKPDPAPNVKSLILHSNQLTNWVAEMILSQSEVKKRVVVIKHFVSVADRCRHLNNFSTLTSIVSALGTAPIHRLNRTWAQVNPKTFQALESMRQLMASTKNFGEYRDKLHQANPPCIPFLGVYLTDLTFIEDGIASVVKNSNLINFAKRAKTAEVIRDIQQYQNVPYSLNPVPDLQEWILDNMRAAGDVHDMYNKSLQIEPREREDEKIARLLSESGFL